MNEMVPVDGASAPRVPMMAGGRPMAIIPNSMDDAYRLGKAICLAGMAPKGMETPEKCMIAIMRGMEVGLTPMQALDKIAIVNGRPTIWGDGALGLVRGSGLCLWVRETLNGTGEAMVAVCETHRRGEPDPIQRTFSVADAKKASLWGKPGPWQQFPSRMLAMRARAFCLRDGFADVLGGLYLKEELDNGEDHAAPVQQPSRAPSPSAAPMIEARPIEPAPQAAQTGRRPPSPGPAPSPQPKPSELAQEPAKAAEPAKPSTAYDPEKVRKRFADAAAKAQDAAALDEAWTMIIDPIDDDALQPDKDDWLRIYKTRRGEIDGNEQP